MGVAHRLSTEKGLLGWMVMVMFCDGTQYAAVLLTMGTPAQPEHKKLDFAIVHLYKVVFRPGCSRMPKPRVLACWDSQLVVEVAFPAREDDVDVKAVIVDSEARAVDDGLCVAACETAPEHCYSAPKDGDLQPALRAATDHRLLSVAARYALRSGPAAIKSLHRTRSFSPVSAACSADTPLNLPLADDYNLMSPT